MTWRRWLVGVGIALVLIGILIRVYGKHATPVATAPEVVASAPLDASAPAATSSLQFEVVTTAAAQEKGLGGRTSIPDNYAMLFVFPTDQKAGFWMKDMLVPIDIIWLADDGRIMKILDSLSPDTYPAVYYPPQATRYVLETRAGYAKAHGWQVGTKVPLPAMQEGN